NDVAMIQEANIGIGIAGKEGLQASRCSDVSICQFRFLQRLLFVHGRYNTVRLTTLILYSFYKSLVIVIPSILFGTYSLWSVTLLLDDTFIMFYNIVLTFLPVFVVALLEKDLPQSELANLPEAYAPFRRKSPLNQRSGAVWLMDVIVHSAAIYVCGLAFYGDTLPGLVLFCSTATYTVCTVRLLLGLASLSGPFLFTVALSTGAFALVLWMVNVVEGLSPLLERSVGIFMSDYRFWLALLLCVLPCVLIDMAVQHIRSHYSPSTGDVVRFRSTQRGCIRKDTWVSNVM
ncbi:P-type ATPase, subfamily IV, partial [Kipferlia bialata]